LYLKLILVDSLSLSVKNLIKAKGRKKMSVN
jgi:hypothetical protein